MYARTLIDDPSGRWSKGEVGRVLESKSDKYDYFLRFEGSVEFSFGGGEMTCRREFYFYKDEVEICPIGVPDSTQPSEG